MRGSLQAEVEAKVFHAEEGAILGPFPAGRVVFRDLHRQREGAPTLDEETRTEIRRLLKDKWLSDQAAEHQLEVL